MTINGAKAQSRRGGLNQPVVIHDDSLALVAPPFSTKEQLKWQNP